MKKKGSTKKNKLNITNLTEYSRETVVNEDILGEIFSRIPVKSLVRLKCVSKHWFVLISDPIFCSTHTQLNKAPSVHGIIYKYRNYPETNYLSLSTVNTSHPSLDLKYGTRYALQHVSHGLALFSNVLGNTSLVVRNIVTKQHKSLPKRLQSSENSQDQSYFLFFDPIFSFRYRVVVVNYHRLHEIGHNKFNSCYDENGKKFNTSGSCYKIDMYCSETGSWKYLYFNGPPGHPFTYKALWNGAIHWMTSGNIHVRFEIDAEKLIANRIKTPVRFEDDDDKSIRYFGECNGNLFLIIISRRGDKMFEILQMDNDDYSRWSMKWVINMMRPLISSFPEIFKCDSTPPTHWRFSVLGFLFKRRRRNNFHLLLALPGKIVSYSLALDTFQIIQKFPMLQFPDKYEYNYAHTFPFQPTLISPLDH